MVAEDSRASIRAALASGMKVLALGAFPTLPFVRRRRRSGHTRGAGPEKPEAYSLEYLEDFFWPKTTQMIVDRSPQ